MVRHQVSVRGGRSGLATLLVVVLSLALVVPVAAQPATGTGTQPAAQSASSDATPVRISSDQALILAGPHVRAVVMQPPSGLAGWPVWLDFTVSNPGVPIGAPVDPRLLIRRDGGIAADDVLLESFFGGQELPGLLVDGALVFDLEPLDLDADGFVLELLDATYRRDGRYTVELVIGEQGSGRVLAEQTSVIEIGSPTDGRGNHLRADVPHALNVGEAGFVDLYFKAGEFGIDAMDFAAILFADTAEALQGVEAAYRVGTSGDFVAVDSFFQGEALVLPLDEQVVFAPGQSYDGRLRLTFAGAGEVWVLVEAFGPGTSLIDGAPMVVGGATGSGAQRLADLSPLRRDTDSAQVLLTPAQGVSVSRVARGASGVLEATGGPSAHVRRAGRELVLELETRVPLPEAQRLAAELEAAGVALRARALPVMRTAAVPNDPAYPDQWHLSSRQGTAPAAGIDVEAAWGRTIGSSQVTVAVIDTGGLDHPDMDGRLVGGHDLISDDDMARRPPGTGRIPDGTDRGDWYEVDGVFLAPSSWHGTHVGGTIGAATDNGRGVAGVDQRAMIQHVRVLGAGGGSSLDVADGIRWAVGDTVAGTEPNATPSDVLNLSLGGPGTCSASSQEAIDVARAADAVVVVAAGNSWNDLHDLPGDPATCSGVLNVAATGPSGARAFYSDFGWPVDIAAPGGAGGGAGWDVLSTLNPGLTTAEVDAGGRPVDHYGWAAGTSMAAPHVAGIVSLMRAANPALDERQLRSLLTDPANVQAFDALPNAPAPGIMACSDNPFVSSDQGVYCGPGIANAGRAVLAAESIPGVVSIDAAAAVAADTASTSVVQVSNVTDAPLTDLELRLRGASDQAASLAIEVWVDGFVPVDHDLGIAAAGPGAPIRVALPDLDPGAQLEVRVRAALPDGRYQLISELWSSDGSLVLPEPGPGFGLPDADRSSVTVDRTSLPADPDHQAQVAVEVRNAAGEPLSGLDVEVAPRDDAADAERTERDAARTDTAGSAVLEVARSTPGTRTYAVSAAGVALDEITLRFHELPVALQVVGEPTTGPIDAPLDPAVEVAFVGADGETIEELDGATVTVDLLGAEPGVLHGSLESEARSGVARFDDLHVTVPGSGYRLGFESQYVGRSFEVHSAPFSRHGTDADHLRLLAQPDDGWVGRSLDPAIEVALVDTAGQPIPIADGMPVEVELLGAVGSQLTGSTSVELRNGVATFDDLIIGWVAQNLRLAFHVEVDGDRYAVTSDPFSVRRPRPQTLVVDRQPTDTVVGAPISPAVVVEVRDQVGAPLAGPGVSSPPVRVRLVTRDGSEVRLRGDQQVEVVEGRATFDGLAPAWAGRDLRLEFSIDLDDGTASVVSQPFSVAGSVGPAGSVQVFSDVPADSTHAASIAAVAAAGITQGCSADRFCPGDPVTRGQMATFLSRALALEDPGGIVFPDVDPGSAHAPGIAAVVDAGIAGGYADGRFGPADLVTRAQMATFLRNARYLPTDVPAANFSDRDRIPEVHRASVDAVAHAGIAGGYADGRYGPGDPVTRGQMATFLYRAFLAGPEG